MEIKQPKDGSKFLWKYFDLHKFISLLSKKKLFFTRLDNFDDPIEGIKTKLLRKYAKLGEPIDPNSPKVADSQKKNYVNCWFTSERESMAMWNLYSNVDSVAIKVEFASLKKELEKSFHNFIETNSNLTICGEPVDYLELNPFNSSLDLQKFKYSALKKDVAYQYESEYRLLINTPSSENPKLFYEIPLNLKELNLIVLTHPKMEQWKIENIKELVKLTDENVQVEKSATMLR